jgi:hypothetical protein
MPDLSTEDWLRFISKIEITEDCWLWKGSIGSGGYGYFWCLDNNYYSHRIVLEHTLGRPIAQNMEACHSCPTRNCCNPEHLREDTHKENILDKVRNNTQSRGENHYKTPFTDTDIISIRNDTRRLCDIARQYGVSSSCILYIKKRKSWYHI